MGLIPFAFDTETYLTRDGVVVPKMVCLSYAHGTKKGVVLADEGCRLLHTILDNPRYCLVGHRLPFDVAVVMRHDPTLIPKILKAYNDGRMHDTLVREKLINLSQGQLEYSPSPSGKLQRTRYGLDALVLKYLHKDITPTKKGDDIWRLRYAELDGVPVGEWPEAARKYAIDDAWYTLEVFECQKQPVFCRKGQVSGPEGVQNEFEQVRADLSLHLMTAWGLRTDRAAVRRLKRKLEIEVDTLNKELMKEGIVRKNGSRDMKALQEVVEEAYDALGKAAPRTPKGAIKTCATALKDSRHPLLIKVAEASTSNKLLSSYVSDLEQGTKIPLTPRYDVLKETGRTSSFKPNVQQLPRKGGVRECFVPRPGYYYCNIDYDTLELRALAQVNLEWFGWSNMADVLVEGRDLHTDLGAQIMGLPYEMVVEMIKGKHGPDAKEAASFHRERLAKAGNFGLPGGLVARSFAKYAQGYGVDLTVHEAENIINIWHNRWQEMSLYFERIDNEYGFADSATMVQLYSNRYRGGARKTAAYNTMFQGLAADGAKEAMWLLTQACYADRSSPLYGSRIVAFIHDEFMLEVPIGKAHEAAHEAARLMRLGMSKFIRDIPVTCEPALMDRWYKKAKPVYENGILVPWQPEEEEAA